MVWLRPVMTCLNGRREEYGTGNAKMLPTLPRPHSNVLGLEAFPGFQLFKTVVRQSAYLSPVSGFIEGLMYLRAVHVAQRAASLHVPPSLGCRILPLMLGTPEAGGGMFHVSN